jgi:7-cyano-7-deazaguanine synthase
MHKSVILLSGGLDSAANLAFCRAWDEPILALTARYGQKAEDQEIEAAQFFCKYYQVPHEVVDLKWLGKIGGSSLTQKDFNIPTLDQSQLNQLLLTQKSAQSVWVPNRNGIFIHVAAAYAEALGAHRVVVGFNREEAVTFPDNSVEYLNRVNRALEFSTSNSVEVFSYTSDWDKKQILNEVLKLSRKFPIEQVWSCYKGGEKPCGICESCQRFTRAKQVLV